LTEFHHCRIPFHSNFSNLNHLAKLVRRDSLTYFPLQIGPASPVLAVVYHSTLTEATHHFLWRSSSIFNAGKVSVIQSVQLSPKLPSNGRQYLSYVANHPRNLAEKGTTRRAGGSDSNRTGTEAQRNPFKTTSKAESSGRKVKPRFLLSPDPPRLPVRPASKALRPE
jgi:hypothetical protein